jgi:hypothetical protein
MAIFELNLDALKVDLDELRAQDELYKIEGERLQGQLDLFNSVGFEEFRKWVETVEMPRLANLRMEKPSDQIMMHERIMGQWAEANMLSQKKETLTQDLRLNNIHRQEQGKALAQMEAKYQQQLDKRK